MTGTAKVFLLVLLLGGVAWLSTNTTGRGASASLTPTPTLNYCPAVQVLAFIRDLEPKIATWDDAERLARSTARIALSPQVQRLQSLRREVQQMQLFGCMHDAREKLLAYMDIRIDTYLAFMSQREVINGEAITVDRRAAFQDGLKWIASNAK
jgi:hypothetical protein